jgi:hypothetical protein
VRVSPADVLEIKSTALLINATIWNGLVVLSLECCPNPRSGNGRSLSCARAWFHKASSTRSGCVLGDTAQEAKSLVESMTDANRQSAIPESRLIGSANNRHVLSLGIGGKHKNREINFTYGFVDSPACVFSRVA